MKTLIVLDKSYLQGATREEINKLCGDYTVLMPEALFFELLTTQEKVRTACFRKLPAVENPVELITHIGALLAHEVETHTPATPVHGRYTRMRFVFNSRLSSGSFNLSEEQRAGIVGWERDIAESVAEFKERAAVTDRWFPSLAGYRPGMPKDGIEKLRQAIGTDSQMIRDIYDAIRHASFPPAAVLDERWAFYRWVQVQLLAVLEYIRRYGIGNALEASWRIPNDVIDMQYTTTGSLVGALASRDAVVQETFKLLCPDGQLVF
ncbi:MAG TPA: hypothetical protein VFE33_29525 [Thermoanaerobaculia bacterium]|nr:hypothetical protein [Thermoanaerobaculia bacterium]